MACSLISSGPSSINLSSSFQTGAKGDWLLPKAVKVGKASLQIYQPTFPIQESAFGHVIWKAFGEGMH